MYVCGITPRRGGNTPSSHALVEIKLTKLIAKAYLRASNLLV